MIEFPPGFFDRADETPDDRFYDFDRFVTHIDDDAIAVVGDLYRQLELTGEVLDLWLGVVAMVVGGRVACGQVTEFERDPCSGASCRALGAC